MIWIPPDRLDAFQQALEERAGKAVDGPGEHERFRVEMGRWHVVGYGTGKITVSDEELMPVIEEVLEELLAAGEGTVIGSDETGKGEWLGPLVVAACAVAPDQRAPLVAEGVMDSKELSASRLDPVADAIEQRLDHHEVVLVSPERFNQLWRELKGEGKGLNDLLAWAHAKAIAGVVDRLEAAGAAEGARVVVDEFDRVRTEARTQRAFDVDTYPVEQRVRAEDEIAVAAASVLAKAARERWIDAFESRAEIPIRSLSRDQAREHARAADFAKTGYL